ncbi:DNA ligase 1-like [Danaus plexippus]|uniref:DNA ligase 1-like n=1 Tax=Danaus plexippus TaxID=13037 RepID=UPI002AB2AC32|nr:DNA ligase 1-like [Danaus plexippus]
MAKTVAEAPVIKTIAKKSKLKNKKPKPKNLKAGAASEAALKQVKKVTEVKPKSVEVQVKENPIPEQILKKYPILKNDELVKKFLSVELTNNQKGRIRQVLRESLKGTAEDQLPDVINNKIQSIMKNSQNLNDSELRRIRILYNMLKLSVHKDKPETKAKNTSKNKIRKERKRKAREAKEKEAKDEPPKDKDKTTDNVDAKEKVKNKKNDQGKSNDNQKVKGPKRYVVFIGNLAQDIDKERLMKHFSDISDFVVDVRIPKPAEGKKSCIAYLELKNESSYELALSKHHTMLDNRRINVLYSTQQNSKITKTEAKGKSAKLVALQKSGQLSGSIPLKKKRSQRRMKAKLAQKKPEQA